MKKIGEISYGGTGSEHITQKVLPVYLDNDEIGVKPHKPFQLLAKIEKLGYSLFFTGWKFEWQGQTYGSFEHKFIKTEHVVDRIIENIRLLNGI